MRLAIQTALNTDKIPYTNEGFALLESINVLETAFTRRHRLHLTRTDSLSILLFNRKVEAK
ncbi:hypothetical protein ACEQPO_08060 [Bacillus sp. SL00103]